MATSGRAQSRQRSKTFLVPLEVWRRVPVVLDGAAGGSERVLLLHLDRARLLERGESGGDFDVRECEAQDVLAREGVGAAEGANVIATGFATEFLLCISICAV